jgi:hypothetical protein
MLFAQATTPTGFEAIRALYWPPGGQDKLDDRDTHAKTRAYSFAHLAKGRSKHR